MHKVKINIDAEAYAKAITRCTDRRAIYVLGGLLCQIATWLLSFLYAEDHGF